MVARLEVEICEIKNTNILGPQEMRMDVQHFSTSLLDHSRTSHELEVMLNYNPIPGSDIWEPGDRQTLDRLKLAIKYKQKMVCL